MAISKIIYKANASATPEVWMDSTPATAVAADILAPKTAMLANGVLTTGTGSGGGGGLVYETGTWIPAEDVLSYSISFANTHTSPPFFYLIADATEGYSDVTTSSYGTIYCHFEQFTGIEWVGNNTGTTSYYGIATSRYRSAVNSIGTQNYNLSYPVSNTGNDSSSYPRYWVTEQGIIATGAASSRYWRSARTYKWIAIWAPST